MNEAYKRTLRAWEKEWSAEHIDDKVRKLINLATFDVLWGPPLSKDVEASPTDEYGNENEWSGYPGFEKACDTIKQALTDLPSELWLDVDAEQWQDSPPENTDCESCDGEGHYDVEPEPGMDSGESFKCDSCLGEGSYEPIWENWVKASRADLKKMVVGQYLAEYV